MDLLDALRTLVARWALSVPLLLLTLGAVAAGYTLLPWSYESTASVVFLSSAYSSKDVGGNAYLDFTGSLTVAADLVSRRMMEQGTVGELKAEGRSAVYKVSLAPDTNGPLLDIQVDGNDPEITQATLESLLQLIPIELNQMQSGSTPDAMIRVDTVAKDAFALRKTSSKLRTLIVALVLGIVVTVSIPLIVESMALRRRAAEEAARQQDEMGDDSLPQLPIWRRDANGSETASTRPASEILENPSAQRARSRTARPLQGAGANDKPSHRRPGGPEDATGAARLDGEPGVDPYADAVEGLPRSVYRSASRPTEEPRGSTPKGDEDAATPDSSWDRAETAEFDLESYFSEPSPPARTPELGS